MKNESIVTVASYIKRYPRRKGDLRRSSEDAKKLFTHGN